MLNNEKSQPIGKKQSWTLDYSLQANRLRVAPNIPETGWHQ